MQISKIDNTSFGMALKIDKGLKKELQTQPAEILKTLDELGKKVSDVKLYDIVLEEQNGLFNPMVKKAGQQNSPDYFLSLKSEEKNLGKWYQIPSGVDGDSVGGFYPKEPFIFKDLYGKDAAIKYKEFKKLSEYDKAAEYSRMLEQRDAKRLVEEAKKKSEKQFAEEIEKIKQHEHENAINELLNKYEYETVTDKHKITVKKGFWDRLKTIF